MDRRKRKSRKAILDACVKLVKVKDFQSITINEIVSQADLNRGTFYLHFADKYDMMDSFENELIEKIEYVVIKNLPEEQSGQHFIQSRYDTILETLKCLEENKDLVQLLLKSSHNSSFQAKLRSTLKLVLEQHMLPKFDINNLNVPIDLLLIIFTSSALSAIEYAYHSEADMDAEKLAKFLINIMVHGPAKTFGFIQHDAAFTFMK